MRSSFSSRRHHALLVGCALALLAGCALGPEEPPGCQSDGECDPGWSCRAGACFHETTGTTPPSDALDAGDGGG